MDTSPSVLEEGQKGQTLLLDDGPAASDAFGPHERISRAIRDLVLSEARGRAIALIGTWGSGKSTIVNLLRLKCLGEDKLKVFVFDAWAHEGDPLRRTFLEQLIQHFKQAGWISGKDWDERLDELAKRRKETTVKSTPQLTGLGSASAALLFAVPVGLWLLSNPSSWVELLGFVLAVSPPILVGLFWLIKRPWLSSREERWSVFSLLASKTEVVTKTETLESPDPTSVEFEGRFRQLAEQALVKDRRLLIVLDNLGRVDGEDARKLWTAMRTFFDFPGDSPPPWAARLWTLVPFDMDGIGKLWDGGSEVSGRFIDKTFQVRFSVPVPLLSDWRSFLREQLKAAFPNRSASEFYTIERFYGILREEGCSPTPRDIKLFVNEVCAAYRTAEEDIPLSHVALFVAARRADRLWTPRSPLPQEDHIRPYLGESWQEDLAALYFTLPKSKARQVLYGEAVEKALADGDGPALKERMATPGVEYLAESVLDQRLESWRDNEPHLLGRAACALDEARLPSMPIWNSVWSHLSKEIQGIKKWPFLDPKAGKGLRAVVTRAGDATVTRGILESLEETPSSESDQKECDLGLWAGGLLEVLNGIVQAGQLLVAQDFLEGSGFGVSEERYLSLLASVSQLQEGRSLWRFLRPGVSEDGVIDALVADVKAGKFGTHAENSCYVMMAVDYAWRWGELISSLQARFNQGSPPAAEGGSALRTLFRLRERSEGAGEAIQNATSTGWLFHCFQLAFQGNNHDASAACVLAALIYEPEASGSSNPGQAPMGRSSYRTVVGNPAAYEPIVEEAVKLASSLGYGGLLLSKRPEVKTARSFIDRVLHDMAADPEAVRLFPLTTIVQDWPSAHEAFGDSQDSFLTKLTEADDAIRDLSEAEFFVDNSDLYRQVLGKRAAEPLLSATVKHLRNLTKEEWAQGWRKTLG